MSIRILFLLRDYEHGGIPRVLESLLAYIDPQKIKADLFVCNPAGIFKGRMANCRVLPGSFLMRLLSCNYRKEHGIFKMTAVAFKFARHALLHFFKRDILLNFAEYYVSRRFNAIYDAVWVCSEDTPAQIAQYIKGNCRRMIWIHNNYNVLFRDVEKSGLPDFLLYEKIVCVSKYAEKALIRVLRQNRGIDLQERTTTLYNILNDREICEKGKSLPEDEIFQTNDFTIVSVGRLAYQKNFEAIPRMAAALKKAGRKFHWYIIGGGAPAMQIWIENEIKQYDVANEVILLGVKSNPYAYIARADLFVLTSRYETYPTVVNEAKALGTPVISTDFGGVEEILFPENGWYGPLEKFEEKLLAVVGRKLTAGERKAHQIDFTEHNQQVIKEFEQILNKRYTAENKSI